MLTNVGVIKTSGGLFNFLSGSRARAPKWMQAIGLEWAWRVWLEPRRLFWRFHSQPARALSVVPPQQAFDHRPAAARLTVAQPTLQVSRRIVLHHRIKTG